jgi:8-oxo-dGTP diphosphatase
MMVNTDIIRCADILVRLDRDLILVERLNMPRGVAIPGGKLEPGETAEDAVRRELPEETGLTLISIDGILGVYNAPGRDPRGHYSSTVFFGRAVGVPRDEPGKTRVIRVPPPYDIVKVIRDHGALVCDHAQIIADYFALTA